MKPLPLLFLGSLPLLLLTASPLTAQMGGPLAGSGAAGPASLTGLNPMAGQGANERPKNARTVIDSDNGASFENSSNTAEFTGHVVVRDPQFDLTCDKLHVVLRSDRKGMEKFIAMGNVIITQEKKNDRGDVVKSVGKCGRTTYDPSTGDVILEEWPQIQQGINSQVATDKATVMILNAKGHSRTIGASRTMIVDQGEKALTP